MTGALLADLVELYGPQRGEQVYGRLREILARAAVPRQPARPLDQRDSLLITYGDQFRRAGDAPLASLRAFARRYLKEAISGIHILPFYPYTSDDGFSVVDYRRVNPDWGSWEDVEALGRDFLLMYDAVINHISASSAWFQGFLWDDPRYREYFITVPEGSDLSLVVRPRTLPLLTPFETARGREWVWTTFSADQIDLNYANPDVLLEILSVLLEYAARGARFLRLDAIAYLWKQAGTPCIHLPQTHAVIRLVKKVLQAAGAQVLLITETNVPHRENLSYFGNGSGEADLVYNFALPPLALDAYARGDARVLSEWAAGLELPSRQVTFFNFLASHDGVGLNPARGILPEAGVEALQARVLSHGGRVSYKSNPDGSQSGYELNISYFDALSDPASGESVEVQAARFLSAHAVLLALQGLPGIYVHSLLGSRSWREGVEQTGMNRTINRQKFDADEVERELRQPGLRQAVYDGMCRLLRARSSTAAFHPYGRQAVLDCGPEVFALRRSSPDGRAEVLCLQNVTREAQTVPLAQVPDGPAGVWRDLLSSGKVDLTAGAVVKLEGYQTAWLVPDAGA